MGSPGVRILPSAANPTSPKLQAPSIVSLPSPTSPSTSEANSRTSTTSPTVTSVNNTGTSDAKHICPECSRRFGRAEHLERHIKVHLPSNASRSFICECCFKGFTRKDVLTRHIRAVHESKRSDVKKSRRRSCKRCAGFKIKCTGGKRGSLIGGVQDGDGSKAEEACDACKKRGVECIYDFGSVGLGRHEAHESEANGNGGVKVGDSVDTGNMLDFPSDGGSVDSENEGDGGAGPKRTINNSDGVAKRRKTINGYSTDFTEPSAIDTNPTPQSRSGPDDLRDSAPDLRKLIGVNAEQPSGLATADRLISLMTTKTYESAAGNLSLTNSTVNSGRQTPEKVPSSTGNSKFTLENHQHVSPHSIFPDISAGKSPALRNIPCSTANLTARNGLQTPHTQKDAQITCPSLPHLFPSLSRPRSPGSLSDPIGQADRTPANFCEDGLMQDKREYLDAAAGLQGMSQWSPPKKDSLSLPNARKSVNINSFVPNAPETQHPVGVMPGVLPPISFDMNVSYDTQYNAAISATEMQGNPIPDITMDNNLDGDKLQQQQDAGMIDDGLVDLGCDDNWFFDFGMFDNSTDWLRDWGDDSSPKEVNTNITSDASYIRPSSERTASTTSLGPTATTPKDHPSPRASGLDRSATGYPSVRSLGTAIDESKSRPTPSLKKKIDPAGNNDFLPWTWSSSPQEERKATITLPPFARLLEDCATPGEKLPQPRRYSYGGNLEGDFILSTPTSDKTRQNMVALLSLPHTRCPYDKANAPELNSNKFPTTKMIHEFIDLYFSNFHAIIPMIHRPTFSLEKSPTIILVAMASIGASYGKMEGSKVYADMLSELCKKTLAWMAEHDPESPRTTFHLTALCLQNVYALGSGSHRLYDYADVSRSFLIGNARRTGLFCGTSSPPPSTPGSPTISNTNQRCCLLTCEEPFFQVSQEEVENQWAQWRKKEEYKRLAWSIFEYDCSFATLSNRRGAITLNDISTRMPCSEALWEAPNAQAWKSIITSEYNALNVQSKDLVIKGLPFYPTLKDLIAGKIQPETLNSWGKRLCAQAIGRILWDFKELEESVLNVGGAEPVGDEYGLGLPMLSPGFKPAKEKLLKTLMRITECIREQHWEKKSGKPGDCEHGHVHLMLSCLTTHYAHLHAAFPAISTILSLARRPPPTSSSSHVDPRITRLKCIFSSDPVYARTLAWHAAQIIALSRWRPICSPIEGMRIFVAGVVLWGFGRYFRAATPSGTGQSQVPGLTSSPLLISQEEVVRLDWLPWTVSANTYNSPSGIKTPDEWIKTGKGKATIGKENDNHREDGSVMTEICSENGAREVLKVVAGILGRMRVWGLGGEFRNVLEEVGNRN